MKGFLFVANGQAALGITGVVVLPRLFIFHNLFNFVVYFNNLFMILFSVIYAFDLLIFLSIFHSLDQTIILLSLSAIDQGVGINLVHC